MHHVTQDIEEGSHAPGKPQDSEFQGALYVLGREQAHWDIGKNCVCPVSGDKSQSTKLD